MAVVSITKGACASIRDSLGSLRYSIEKEIEELRTIIRDGVACDSDYEDFERCQSSLIVLSALQSRLRELERGAES